MRIRTLPIVGLGLLLAACAGPQLVGPPIHVPAADAREAIRMADSEHALVRLTTVDDDTLIGRVSMSGGEIRVTGSDRRLRVDELTSVARATPLEPEGGRGFRIAGILLIVALVAPLAGFAAAYGEEGGALLLLLGAAVVGGILGAAAAEVDDPAPVPTEWTNVWEAE